MIKNDIKFFTKIEKIDEEKRMVYGICTSEAVDSQGEIIKSDAIQKAWDNYMEYANVREMHQPSAVGVTKEYEHSDSGTMIGVHVVDDRAWKFVKEGVYKGFSIGGRVIKKVKNIITEIVLSEISLVDRPANPDAKFTAVKFDGALVDRLQQERLINNNKSMKKFIEIDGVKYVEDEENTGQPKLDENGERIPFEEEKEAPVEGENAGEEKPVEETPAEDAPAEETPAEENPAAEDDKGEATEDENAEEENGKETSDKPVLTKVSMPAAKSSMGVITLAGLLDHALYIKELFDMNSKDTNKIEDVVEVIKSLVAVEAGEPDSKTTGAKTEDLAKMGDQITKSIADIVTKKFEDFGKSQEDLSKRVDNVVDEVAKMKGQKVSPRPKVAAAVEKGFENQNAGSADVAKKQEEVRELANKIDDFAVEMQETISSDPSKRVSLEKRSKELFGQYQTAKRELNDLLAQGSF